MAHALYQGTMAFTGDVPWHGLGTQFAEAMTAEQAITAAHLDYNVSLEQLTRPNGTTVPAFATINDSTGDLLGVVGKRFVPLQNKDAFAFFDVLLDEGARYQSAGAIGLGERMWLLASMPQSFEPLLGDKVGQYMLLTHAHDGSGAITARMTAIRVVCQNTLNAALAGTTECVSIRHTAGAKGRLEQAAMILKEYNNYFTKIQSVFQDFANFKVDDAFIAAYTDALFGAVTQTPEGAARTIRMGRINAWMERLDHGMGVEIPGVADSAWGLYNAAIEFADYAYPTRKATDKAESVLFGGAMKFKQRAFDSALVLVNAR